MIERLRAALSRRPPLGVAISLAIHAVLLLALFWVPPGHKPTQKRGDALIVELPSLDEPANRGTPGPAINEPPAPAAPAPRPAARPTPPTPKTAAAPRVTAPARSTPNAESREVPRAVARAAQPAPSVERGDAPTAKSVPQPVPDVAKATVDTAKPAPERSPSDPPAPPVVSAPVTPPGPVAMVPPSAPDIRSALRRGGGGGGGIGSGGASGTGIGRGGIVGEPVALDSKDTDLSDYLERIRRLIKQNWAYPCIKDQQTGACEYKSTELVVEFGILKHGPVQYVEVRRASPYGIYDSYAVNAIKLASPFPPVPAVMMARMQQGSTGAAIVARFVYHFDSGITNFR